jgi:hypothetical protein
MNISELENLSLVNFAKLVSIDFWNRIYFARNVKGRLRVSEITLTENLVYQFFLMAASRKLPVKIFQSKNENVNGSDMELLIELNGNVIKFPCQAKIIYATRRYGALYHQVGKEFQIDLLLRHARKIGGYPIYMFYNYEGYMTDDLLKLTDGEERFWGCSVGSASEIKNRFFAARTTPPTFHEMHPGTCWPFYKLFELVNSRGTAQSITGMLKGFDLANLKKYSIDDIIDDPTFTDLTSSEGLGFVDHFDKVPSVKIEKAFTKRDARKFNPRFRILVTKDNLIMRSLQYLD